MTSRPDRSFAAATSLSGRYRATGVTFADILTADSAMRACLDRAACLAAVDFAALLQGETGTGKNLVAQAIHNASPRRARPFIEVTCGAIPDSLAEAELFGHMAGAFTGADRERAGWFALADGGTLFLDEIGDLAISTQARLLRAVERGEFAALGSSTVRRVNVRIIAATNIDLAVACAEGRFRSDLYYRLNEVCLSVPPLRARGGDITLLAQKFIADCASRSGRVLTGIEPVAERLLAEHAWPGNVRELRAAIRRGAAVAQGPLLTWQDLGVRLALDVGESEARATADPGELSLAAAERRHVAHVLRLADFNKSRAARLLGIARNTLDRKIEEFGITASRSEDARQASSSVGRAADQEGGASSATSTPNVGEVAPSPDI